MGERKVLNKYIDPTFDPSLVPRGKKLSTKDGTVPVRMMLPFSIQCKSCKTFLYRGTKFNSKKEPMGGPHGKYLGIQRWRFYIKCTACSAPISFLTDPQNADYEMESGATRNYEVHKDKKETEEKFQQEKEEEEKADHMKALENRVLESQKEQQDYDNMEQIKAMSYRHVKLLSATGEGFEQGVKNLLDKINPEEAEDGTELELTQEDEALVKSIKFGGNNNNNNNNKSNGNNKKRIRRLDKEDEKRAEQDRQQQIALLEQRQKEASQKLAATKENKAKAFPIIKAKRRRVDAPAATTIKAKPKVAPVTKADSGGGMASLLGGYGSDSDSD
ncbi:coil domain-containing protein 94 [Seminavis robusta]|uniref:Splicing factor YJU2 n=1 Tax=Seminavis robusta TaxID=568900 RepID=A0A9N8DIY8_9STRA|nr:coil domain-containing protein 94 [Seminavis robusta]|eukprot:Sro169_g075010.1 coil domain-containing protein 94 (331) ;mRNA; f:18424-19416